MYIWNLDFRDRSHPFGLNKAMNEKHALGISGEQYGKNVFVGRFRAKDTPEKRLNKIEWLVEAQNKEVKWRRALCFAIFFTMIMTSVINPTLFSNTKYIISSILTSFLAIYFLGSYESYHVNYYKQNYISRHIQALKKSFNFKSENPLLLFR